MDNIDLAKRAAMIELRNKGDKRLLFVAKSDLVNSSFSLTLMESYLIRYAAARARELQRGFSDRSPLEINVLEFARQFELRADHSYSQVKNACLQLLRRQLIYFEGGRWVETYWVTRAEYNDGKGELAIVFSEKIAQMITRIDGRKDKYLSYQIDDISSLRTPTAIRLFELMALSARASSPMAGQRLFSIDELKKIIGVDSQKHAEQAIFKRDVLNPAIKNVNEETKLNILCEPVRESRKIIGYKLVGILAETNK